MSRHILIIGSFPHVEYRTYRNIWINHGRINRLCASCGRMVCCNVCTHRPWCWCICSCACFQGGRSDLMWSSYRQCTVEPPAAGHTHIHTTEDQNSICACYAEMMLDKGLRHSAGDMSCSFLLFLTSTLFYLCWLLTSASCFRPSPDLESGSRRRTESRSSSGMFE